MTRAADNFVWLSGRYLRVNRARIPVTSESITGGVGLYETLLVIDGRAPLLDLHLARLRTACLRLGLKSRRHDWGAILQELSRRNGRRRARGRIQLGQDFELVSCGPLPRSLRREKEQGIELPARVLQRPAADMKHTSRLALWLAEQETGGETALLSEQGELLETTRSNLFVLTKDGIETAEPPRVLPGIGRALLLDLAKEMGLSVQLQAPLLKKHSHWREAWVTNALRGVRPVNRIGGISLPKVGPSSWTRRLQSALDERILQR